MGRLINRSVAEGRNSGITSSTPLETLEERISIILIFASYFASNLMSEINAF